MGWVSLLTFNLEWRKKNESAVNEKNSGGGVALLLISGLFANQALAAATPKPVITSANTKSCVVGMACSYQITATNSPTSYNATPLPAGLIVSTTTGLISGTPTTAATTSVTVSATNAGGTGTLAVTFTISLPPAKVVVAPSGGNYTTITAAMAAINPTATAPVVIEVWPGVYTEPGTVNLKSYVHIKGSGREVTTVKTSQGTAAFVISAYSVTNVAVTGLSLTGGYGGIRYYDAVGTISDNSVSGNTYGMVLNGSTTSTIPPYSLRVTGNVATGNSASGIYVVGESVVIDDNVITKNGNAAFEDGGISLNTADVIISGNVSASNTGSGIVARYSTIAKVSNNIITGNTFGGVTYVELDTGGTLNNNTILNNGDSVYKDVTMLDSSPSQVNPNISFNIFNTILGTRGVGSYNVNSNGDPILVP